MYRRWVSKVGTLCRPPRRGRYPPFTLILPRRRRGWRSVGARRTRLVLRKGCNNAITRRVSRERRNYALIRETKTAEACTVLRGTIEVRGARGQRYEVKSRLAGVSSSYVPLRISLECVRPFLTPVLLRSSPSGSSRDASDGGEGRRGS